ncbi:cardiolipin synthase [Urbifossiella limnaea]|uniref:Cardiolipin synthase n=1 Tax=Urbifossiella limnaea TaxID=2528023 RepID=A0A517XSI3_9BACT|nr:cardiolipin synthase [Urbifossiella limnaea]QDU20461.1 Major cardiolipin synthase ClsA [Urbifossiella limnaea]
MTAFLDQFWQDVAGWLFLLEVVVTVGTLLSVLHLKREPMSAIAWSLAVILLPLVGPLMFFVFGYQTISRPIRRKQHRRKKYLSLAADVPAEAKTGEGAPGPRAVPRRWEVLAKLAHHPEGFPVTAGNRVELYHLGETAYAAMLAAIAEAKHHVHIEFFIFRPDESGRRFVAALTLAARRGVEVRFLYDSVGSHSTSQRLFKAIVAAGGKVSGFLPLLNPVYRFRVNLRNHRKILVVDGRVGFTGGLNIGDEYVGKVPQFGHWRDTHLRVEGPAVESLQRVFLEDWHFATEEAARGPAYYPVHLPHPGTSLVQIVHSGPDAEHKAVRESYFAGILRGRKRVWIASPYYVPDAGVRDALVLAGRAGVDVRLLCLFRPDHWVAFLAARYYWPELLAAGVKVYQYARGMMHSKYLLVDGEWASVGSANLDNRSLLLNYEANALIYDAKVVAELEAEFLNDLEWSVRIDPEVFAARPAAARLAENAARLLSPIL